MTPDTFSQNQRAIPWFRMVMTSLWSRDESDTEDDIYEHDVRLHKPGTAEPETVFVGEFRFERPNQRVEVMIAGQPFNVSGTVLLESRLRKKGTFDWTVQTYEIPIKVQEFEE